MKITLTAYDNRPVWEHNVIPTDAIVRASCIIHNGRFFYYHHDAARRNDHSIFCEGPHPIITANIEKAH